MIIIWICNLQTYPNHGCSRHKRICIDIFVIEKFIWDANCYAQQMGWRFLSHSCGSYWTIHSRFCRYLHNNMYRFMYVFMYSSHSCISESPSRSHSPRADSRFAFSQWETALLCNDVSHWLGASLESALIHLHPGACPNIKMPSHQ